MHFPFEEAIRMFLIKAYLTVFFKPETDLRNIFETYSKEALFITNLSK